MKNRRSSGTGLFLLLFSIFIISLGTVIGLMMTEFKNQNTEETALPEAHQSQPEIIIPDEAPTNNSSVNPPEISFQDVVEHWANSVGGTKSVLIYDLDLDKIVGSYNTSQKYNTASLYKLFVVYEGYRRLERGIWNSNDILNETGKTILKCLDLAIRESNSVCAEALWAKIGHSELDKIIKQDFYIYDSDISNLISTPEDMLKIMQIIYKHEDINVENIITQLKDSFLNQPTTEYNWRQGLPSGFSKANVYNKVGWLYNPEKKYWEIYHDVAIVDFTEQNRHYVVIVMTNNVPYQSIRRLGSEIESTFYANMY